MPVLAFALSVSVVTGIVAGAVPAWHAARLSPTEGLREGGRATGGSAMRLRSVLVVAQVTVALVLLVGTGMMLRSIVNLTATSPGFEPKDVYVGQVALAEPRYKEEPDARRFVQNALERVRAIPGVESVGMSNLLPLSGWSDWSFKIEGDPPLPVSPDAQTRMVAGDYFQTLGMRLLAGRYLGPSDTHDAPDVAVISELTVKKYFRGRNPLGMRIVYRSSGIAGKPRTYTVVGIVADTRDMGIDEPVQAVRLLALRSVSAKLRGLRRSRAPARRFGPPAAALGYRCGGPHATRLRHAAAAGFGRSITRVSPVHAPPLSVFAALGLGLAVLGIYGITSYSVVQRTQEIAVRMAMGADDVAIVRLVLAQALRLVGLGLFFGAVLAAVLGRYLASLIYGLSPWDPQAVGFIAATDGVGGARRRMGARAAGSCVTIGQRPSHGVTIEECVFSSATISPTSCGACGFCFAPKASTACSSRRRRVFSPPCSRKSSMSRSST